MKKITKKMKVFMLMIGYLFAVANLNAQALIKSHVMPNYPGNRAAFIKIDYNGNVPNNVKVMVYYSTSKSSVETGNCSNGRAFNETPTDDDYKFYFPTSDNPMPNYPKLGNEDELNYFNLKNIANLTDNQIKQSLGVTDVTPAVYNHSKANPIFYKVVIQTTVNGNTKSVSSDIASFVMPRHFIISYCGDSYTAGEGAPNEEGLLVNDNDRWINVDAHRSNKSGGELAFQYIKHTDRGLSMRYINNTYSGAIIKDFWEPRQDDWGIPQSGVYTRPAQLKLTEDWMNRNNRDTVDLLIMGVGGNDSKFADVAVDVLTNGEFSNDNKRLIADNVKRLNNKYTLLDEKIRYGYDFEVANILLMGIPDPTKDKAGLFCKPDPTGEGWGDCWGLVEERISQSDFEDISNDFVKVLNDTMQSNAKRLGWKFLNIKDNANRNGLCNCEVPYFNTIGQAIAIQGSQFGTMHPNATGYRRIYKQPIIDKFKSIKNFYHEELAKNAIVDRIKAQIAAESARNNKAKMKAQIIANAKLYTYDYTKIALKVDRAKIKKVVSKTLIEDKKKIVIVKDID
jgi:hypothetical protein